MTIGGDILTALPLAPLRAITGDENVLVLVPRPGDESLLCGGLIAGSCRRGRPPFVMVLGDGAATDHGAARHARATVAAAGLLGLDRERVLMAGIRDGHLLPQGAVFDAAVRAVAAVMWRWDCNVVCGPDADSDDPGEHAAGLIAAAVAARSGVGRLGYPGRGWRPRAAAGWRLSVAADMAAKRAAIAVHGNGDARADTEPYLRP